MVGSCCLLLGCVPPTRRAAFLWFIRVLLVSFPSGREKRERKDLGSLPFSHTHAFPASFFPRDSSDPSVFPSRRVFLFFPVISFDASCRPNFHVG
ncbi:hypothetical protein [Phaffia rhodozyma]|uniref:Secreted protein n=1 Tax=Phaffia rhodozyma TaxID=264483 RepID=A0A0F7SVM3_PHARH|nr:hypothetical protein [Phaffia rhodozyma]